MAPSTPTPPPDLTGVDTDQGYRGPVSRSLYEQLVDYGKTLDKRLADLQQQANEVRVLIDELLVPRLIAWRERRDDAGGWGWSLDADPPPRDWWRHHDPSWEFVGRGRRGGVESAVFRMWLMREEGERSWSYEIPASFVFADDKRGGATP